LFGDRYKAVLVDENPKAKLPPKLQGFLADAWESGS